MRRVLPSAGLAAMAALLLLGLLSAPQAHAQWKWLDKNRQVNASDRPPPKDVPDKDILSRPSPEARRNGGPAQAASGAASVPGLGRGPLDRELDQRKKTAEQEQAAKTKADEERLAAQRAENCRRARGQMSALESGQRMARVNEKGEREILDDKGRAEEMRQARDAIASECK